MGSAIATIIIEFISKDGMGYTIRAEGADMTIWRDEVYDEFGHFIDEGDLKSFLEGFNDFDYVFPKPDVAYNVITSQMGGLDNIISITFDYKKKDPYGDGDDSYSVVLMGGPHSNENLFTEKSNSIFGEDEAHPCEGMLQIDYKNDTLESLLSEHNYSCEKDDYTSILCYEGVPEYYGVETITQLTETLLAVLIRSGSGLDGYEQALIDAFDDIENGFSYIEGTAQEEIDPPDLSPTGESFSCGYDFELKNGEYVAEYRECYGGW